MSWWNPPLRRNFTPKKSSQKFSTEHKMALRPTFSVNEIDWSYLFLHMLDHMLQMGFFPMFFSLFNNLMFNSFQTGQFQLLLLGFLCLGRGCLFQFDLNARCRFFLGWLWNSLRCGLLELKGFGLFGLGFGFGLLLSTFEGRPLQLERNKNCWSYLRLQLEKSKRTLKNLFSQRRLKSRKVFLVDKLFAGPIWKSISRFTQISL